MENLLRRWGKAAVMLAALIGIGWILSQAHEVVLIAVLSFLLYYLLDPLVTLLENRDIDRTYAVTLVFVVLAVVLGTVFFWVVPVAVNQFLAIKAGLSAQGSSGLLEKLDDLLTRYVPFLEPRQLDLAGKVRDYLQVITARAFNVLFNLISILAALIIVPLATFFLLKDGSRMRKSLIEKVPNRYFEMTLSLLHKIDGQIGGYIRGQLIDALIVGVMTTVGLYVLNLSGLAHVRYFVVIGTLAGMANLVPLLGPVAGSIPALILTGIDMGPESCLWVGLLFIGIKAVDDVLVQPMVVARSVDLHPLTVIFALIIGGSLMGILGMVVAVPTAGVLKVTFKEVSTAVDKYGLF